MSSSAVPPVLSGMIPGILDPSQQARILRNPSSHLHFASFHPHAASPSRELLNIQSLSLNEELYRPKRVVVELTPEGSFWRFVPRARREKGVQDEGFWPKLVDICGQIVNCSQDQWDIYMLDPAYTCLIRALPQLPIIIRDEAYNPEDVRPPMSNTKRPMPTPSPESNATSPPKKPRMTEAETDDELDSDKVEDTSRSERSSQNPTPAGPSGYQQCRSKMRAEMERIRRIRREKIKRSCANLEEILEDQVMADLSPQDTSSSTTKRKEPEREGNTNAESDSDSSRFSGSYPPNKRVRTRSPEPTRSELMGKRARRGKQRAQEKRQKKEQLRRARDEAFEQGLYGTYPEQVPHVNDNTEPANQEPQDNQDESGEVDPEELARREIEESRLKIADLEKDRPIWEEEARKRKMKEEAERREEQAAKEAREKEAKAERLEKERREREAKVRAEKERIQREEAARREKERKRSQHRSQWARGPWSIQRALERYRSLSEQFDDTKLGQSEPLAFEDVPWPMLASSFSVEDIEWAAVEKFFESVKPHMRLQDYKVFVEKSHRRFHPDRWRARGLLTSIPDDEDRECIEVAANTVAQALTPLWRQVKR